MPGKDFLTKKSFNPTNWQNLEKVAQAEAREREREEREKEYARQIAEELELQEIKKLQVKTGQLKPSALNRQEFLYKPRIALVKEENKARGGNMSTEELEEYLLGNKRSDEGQINLGQGGLVSGSGDGNGNENKRKPPRLGMLEKLLIEEHYGVAGIKANPALLQHDSQSQRQSNNIDINLLDKEDPLVKMKQQEEAYRRLMQKRQEAQKAQHVSVQTRKKERTEAEIKEESKNKKRKFEEIKRKKREDSDDEAEDSDSDSDSDSTESSDNESESDSSAVSSSRHRKKRRKKHLKDSTLEKKKKKERKKKKSKKEKKEKKEKKRKDSKKKKHSKKDSKDKKQRKRGNESDFESESINQDQMGRSRIISSPSSISERRKEKESFYDQSRNGSDSKFETKRVYDSSRGSMERRENLSQKGLEDDEEEYLGPKKNFLEAKRAQVIKEMEEKEKKEAHLRSLSRSHAKERKGDNDGKDLNLTEEEIREKLKAMQDNAEIRDEHLRARRSAIDLDRQKEKEEQRKDEEKQQIKKKKITGTTDDMELTFIRDVAKDAINRVTLEQKLQMKRTDKALRK